MPPSAEVRLSDIEILHLSEIGAATIANGRARRYLWATVKAAAPWRYSAQRPWLKHVRYRWVKMPELPEVETVRRGLAPTMEGARIARLELRRKDLRFPFPDGLEARATGREIVALGRRAKYLLIDLDDGTTIISHL